MRKTYPQLIEHNQYACSIWRIVTSVLDDAETLIPENRDVYLDLMQEIAQEALRRFSDKYGDL